jgi:hypothetical protein
MYQTKTPRRVYTAALYNILKAMNGHRLFDRFGFNLTKVRKFSTGLAKQLTNYDEWEYEPKLNDCLNHQTGELLTKYLPSSELLNLLVNNIDSHSE